MLSDHERSTLHEIQRQFLAEDPQFVQIFDTPARRLPADAPKPLNGDRRIYTVLMWMATMLGLVLWVAGSPGGALLFAAAAVMFALAVRRGDATTPRT